MVTWAATRRRQPDTWSWGAICSEYKALRVLSSDAPTTALSPAPPEATTPTAANWLAPVKVTSEKREVWSTLKPAATPAAPKATP